MVYYSETKTQVGQVAGAIHLNKLPVNQVPAIEQLMDNFVDHKIAGQGTPIRLGSDEFGNEIFTLYLGKVGGLGLQTVYFLLSAHSNPLDWKFFNVPITMGYFARITAFILRQLNLDRLEKKVVARSIQKNYRDIAALVRQTKELSMNHGETKDYCSDRW
jgi:hypothetical protein